ncbi:MAG: hypothetical protein HQK62_01985 [Desulfamplus sp.]|nr:hypothetical protein [Desulfamplus sp.]MBF0257600.1 hypothetical protein [Desulfamplus sp.]
MSNKIVRIGKNICFVQSFILLSLKFTAAGILLIFTFAAAGCSVLKPINELKSDKKIIDAGEDAFMQGNYQIAQAMFSKVISSSTNRRNKNTALYNLACTKLITAESDAEFIEAAEMLMHWKSSPKIPMYYENPQLIIKALIKSTHLLKDKNKDDDDFKGFNAISDMHEAQEIDSIVKETNQMNSRLDRLLREQDGKIKTLNNLVKKQNEKIKLLNAIFKKETKEKEEMEKTINTLKHQISELESIDRKLQHKRKTQ